MHALEAAMSRHLGDVSCFYAQCDFHTRRTPTDYSVPHVPSQASQHRCVNYFNLVARRKLTDRVSVST